jgi:hypothetical protein
MRLARTARLLYRASIWLAGVEPAISGSRHRRGGQAPLQPGQSTTVESNHAVPPYQSGACPAGLSSIVLREAVSARCSRRVRPAGGAERVASLAGARKGAGAATADAFRKASARRESARRIPALRTRLGRRQGIAPCSTGSRPAGSLQALRRSLAGRSRTPVHHGRNMALSTELRREDALDGNRTRLTRETARPHRQTRPRAWHCRDLVGEPGFPHLRSPERDSNPRPRCERPASSIR